MTTARASCAAVGFIGVGELAVALATALRRAHPALAVHLSPRGAALGKALVDSIGARRHESNAAVAGCCDTLVVGVRPADVEAVAADLALTPAHHVLVLAAGVPQARLAALFAPARVTRVMTGLAVSEGRSAISVYPDAAPVQALLAPACGALIGFADEAGFDASILAVCMNAWWLAQLAHLQRWLCDAAGMRVDEARALLAANIGDVAALLHARPDADPGALAARIGTPGTYTAAGLEQLAAVDAHGMWSDALAVLLGRLRAGT